MILGWVLEVLAAACLGSVRSISRSTLEIKAFRFGCPLRHPPNIFQTPVRSAGVLRLSVEVRDLGAADSDGIMLNYPLTSTMDDEKIPI